MLNVPSTSEYGKQAALSRFLRLAVIGQILTAIGMVVLVTLRTLQ